MMMISGVTGQLLIDDDDDDDWPRYESHLADDTDNWWPCDDVARPAECN